MNKELQIITDYEINSSPIVYLCSYKWSQYLYTKYVVWKIGRKYRRFKVRMANKDSIECLKKMGLWHE